MKYSKELVCVFVLGAFFAIKEYKAHIPVITVKQFAYTGLMLPA